MSLLIRLSAGSGFSTSDIGKIVATAPARYKRFTIPKKSGQGSRLIAQPARELKRLQRFLVTEELSELPVSENAYAYAKDRGIALNASQHAESNYLLKIDFSDFFPSIVPEDLFRHIRNYSGERYSRDELEILKQLFFWRPEKIGSLQLSVGAPSSPFLSNTLMFDFDVSVGKLCAERDVTYTRYADDLAFSCMKQNVLGPFLVELRALIRQNVYPANLRINERKTVFTSRKHFRQVTGVVLASSGFVSLGRKRKRYIKSLVHKSTVGLLSVDETNHLKGLLAFAFDVEADFVTRLRLKYGHDVIDFLLGKNTIS